MRNCFIYAKARKKEKTPDPGSSLPAGCLLSPIAGPVSGGLRDRIDRGIVLLRGSHSADVQELQAQIIGGLVVDDVPHHHLG
jgi:hypothetical protein